MKQLLEQVREELVCAYHGGPPVSREPDFGAAHRAVCAALAGIIEATTHLEAILACQHDYLDVPPWQVDALAALALLGTPHEQEGRLVPDERPDRE